MNCTQDLYYCLSSSRIFFFRFSRGSLPAQFCSAHGARVFCFWVHYHYCGGQGSRTTLGPFFRRKKMSQKVTKLFSKKKYFSFFFSKKKLSKKNVVKKKCVFLFFFPKKISRKNENFRENELWS